MGTRLSFVSLVKASRDIANVKQAIAKSLDLINYSFPEDARKIIIKPNLCYYWDYSTGQTTDPRFVAALIDLLRERVSDNLEISIVESDASAVQCDYAFKFLGYEKMAQDKKVRLVNLSKEKSRPAKVEVNGRIFSFKLPRIIEEADLRINVPKMKYHPLTKVSCALKNIYGCNPFPRKFKYHSRLNQIIVALNKIMQIDLCILDGLIVFGGSSCRLNLVMSSVDPVALDSTACKIMGVNPKSVSHLLLAYKERVGNINCVYKGVSPNHFKERFPRESASQKIMQIGYRLVIKLRLSNRLGLN